MTDEEYKGLKKWADLHPKQQSTSPIPASELMKNLIGKGFLVEIHRPCATDGTTLFVVGYEITKAGYEAIKGYEGNR